MVTHHQFAVVFGSFIVGAGLAVGAVTLATAPPVEPSRAGDGRQITPSIGPDRAGLAAMERTAKELDLIRPTPKKLAADFTVKTSDGRMFRLSAQRGHVVFINFWATWCPPCREEMPAMQRLFERTKKDGLMMLAVSVDADPQEITPFLREQRFTFTIGLDPKMALADRYGVRGLPASFVVDGDGYLAALAVGPRSWDSAPSQAFLEGMARR